MSPYPTEPVEARGPMRLVWTAFPDRERALAAVRDALGRRLAACANVVAAESRYWWRGRQESATESLVIFKTAPKLVGALFARLAERHPYAVPEIVEIDVSRVHGAYLEWLGREIDPSALRAPRGGGVMHPGARRGRGARRPGRTRGRPRPRSTGTGRKR